MERKTYQVSHKHECGDGIFGRFSFALDQRAEQIIKRVADAAERLERLVAQQVSQQQQREKTARLQSPAKQRQEHQRMKRAAWTSESDSFL